jgi:hypothetical protein
VWAVSRPDEYDQQTRDGIVKDLASIRFKDPHEALVQHKRTSWGLSTDAVSAIADLLSFLVTENLVLQQQKFDLVADLKKYKPVHKSPSK